MHRDELEAELETLHPDAFGWALSCCDGERATAEDVLQASYLKVLDGRARFGGRSTLRTWLFGVVRRTASEHRRRRTARRLLSLGALNGRPEERAPGPDAATLVERDRRARRLTGALEELSRRQREVLHLVFYQELTIEAAAEVMGVSLGTARTHYQRGKARLRGLLEEERSP